MVGAGAGGFGAPTDGAGAMLGAGGAPTPVGDGGRMEGADGAGGASDALRVTRTVSFLRGIDEVEGGCGISFSLIRGFFGNLLRLEKPTSPLQACQTSISLAPWDFCPAAAALFPC